MPKGDGTGPRGMGAGTGRGLGGCRASGAAGINSGGQQQGYGNRFSRDEANFRLAAGRTSTGRGRGLGLAVRDLFFSWFERVTRH